MKIRRSQLRDVVTARAYEGEGFEGATYADPVTVLCNVDERRRMVSRGDGSSITALATLHLHPQTHEAGTRRVVDPEELFKVGSLVTVRGREGRVEELHVQTMRGETVLLEAVVA